MKKNLVLFLILGLMVTGCNDKKEEVTDNNTNNNVTNEVENNNQTQEETKEEENNDVVEEQPVDNSNVAEPQPEQNTVVTQPESTPSVSEQPSTSDNASDSSNEQTNTDVTVQPEAPSCTPKKFSQTYTYAYTTKEECVSKGNNAFMDVYENVDSTIFTYGCEEIVDECGTTWYGVYFNRWSGNGGDEVTRLYY